MPTQCPWHHLARQSSQHKGLKQAPILCKGRLRWLGDVKLMDNNRIPNQLLFGKGTLEDPSWMKLQEKDYKYHIFYVFMYSKSLRKVQFLRIKAQWLWELRKVPWCSYNNRSFLMKRSGIPPTLLELALPLVPVSPSLFPIVVLHPCVSRSCTSMILTSFFFLSTDTMSGLLASMGRSHCIFRSHRML